VNVRISRMRRPSWRTGASLAAAVAIVAGGIVTAQSVPAPRAASSSSIHLAAAEASTSSTAGTVAAAGGHRGGCTPHAATEGFDIGVCIDDHGTSTTAYPDVYVNSAPLLGLRESCKIDVETWDDHNHKLGDTPVDCSIGNHKAAPLTVASTTRVHSFARLWFDGSSYPTADSPTVTINGINELTYNYGYPLAYPPAPTPEAVLTMARNHFSAYFPFGGCGTALHVGQICHLTGTGPAGTWGPGSDNPIQVVSVGTTSFTFLSLPGHAEGPGRIITFSFLQNPMTQRLYLDVSAQGPWSLASESTRDTGAARGFWQAYASNLQAAIAKGQA
jgi:hypothetical protein